MKKPRRKWLWAGAAVALTGTLAAMYAYEKSLEEDFERMLRSALQQFRAGQDDSAAHAREQESPETRDEPAGLNGGPPSLTERPAE